MSSMCSKFADLHLHTVFSDGTYKPEELVEKAYKTGLSAIAVVDHDTVAGVSLSIAAARERNIEVIPGIELTAEYDGLEVHILGYLLDYKHEELLGTLDALGENRRARVYKILDKLNELGIKLDPQAVFDLASHGTAGRLHIARVMEKAGVVRSTAEAFHRYIGDNCPAYVCGFRFSPLQAIELIKKFSGIAVLAHPYLLHNDALILEFIKCGIQGIEVYYPEHTQSMINLYLGLAKEHGLLVTGGSDCHGKAKTEVKIGMVKLPYALVQELKDAKDK